MKRVRSPRGSGRMKPCKSCGKTFYCHPCRDVGGWLDERVFCSRGCQQDHAINPVTILARFWKHVQKTEGCWIYTSSIKPDGYRFFRYRTERYGKTVQWYAHRYSWFLANGQIPEGMDICHTCDNTACVNPAHLFAGTASDNMQDMLAKGRKARCTLKPDQVREIRIALQSPRQGLQRELEKKYGVPRGTVSRINVGRTYQWVK